MGWAAMTADYFVRPMTPADVPSVERLTDTTWFDLETRTHRTGWPEPRHRSEGGAADWRLRMEHLVGHDPRGCWVAEDDSGLLGAVASMRRDTTWLLATYAVRPGVQGRGIGRQLLDAALSYGSGCLRGMLGSSEDPLAVRRYRAAGFTLHPSMLLRGVVPRAMLPVVERVREGSAGDIDLMNSVDRQVRGAAHGVDHDVLSGLYRLVVADRATGSGYAYVAAVGRELPAGRHQPAHRHRPALGDAGRVLPRGTGHHRQRHRRQRVGRGRGDGVPDGAVDPRLPRAPRHEAAVAVPAQRPLPLNALHSSAVVTDCPAGQSQTNRKVRGRMPG